MNNCNTCWYHIREYDLQDKASFYCHLGIEKEDNCTEYKPRNVKEYTERQFKRVTDNLSNAEAIIIQILKNRNEIDDIDIEELFGLVSDSRNRLEGIKHYGKVINDD